MRRIFCSDLRWLAGLTWARVGWTCALAAACALNAVPARVLDAYFRFDVPIMAYAKHFFSTLPGFLYWWLVLMLLATVADNLPLRGTKRILAFVLAGVLGIWWGQLEECLFLGMVYTTENCADFPSWRHFVDRDSLLQAMLVAVVGIAWLSYRRDAAAAAALHAIAQDRTRLQRRTLDVVLKARQARVEPEFLLDILTAVAAKCEDDAGRAERMIDELVSYLRAALPDDRDEASTLGRDLRMADAYLALMSLRTEGRVRHVIEVPAELHVMSTAPAVLLPLVVCLVPHRCLVTEDGIDVRIEATPAGEDLRILIVRNGDAGAAPSPLALTDLRNRLRERYGDAASLTIDATSGTGAQFILVLPRTLERVGERNAVADVRATAPEMPFDPAHQGA